MKVGGEGQRSIERVTGFRCLYMLPEVIKWSNSRMALSRMIARLKTSTKRNLQGCCCEYVISRQRLYIAGLGTSTDFLQLTFSISLLPTIKSFRSVLLIRSSSSTLQRHFLSLSYLEQQKERKANRCLVKCTYLSMNGHIKERARYDRGMAYVSQRQLLCFKAIKAKRMRRQ